MADDDLRNMVAGLNGEVADLAAAIEELSEAVKGLCQMTNAPAGFGRKADTALRKAKAVSGRLRQL